MHAGARGRMRGGARASAKLLQIAGLMALSRLHYLSIFFTQLAFGGMPRAGIARGRSLAPSAPGRLGYTGCDG